ncbi:MAG TPA: phosphoribosyltransferase [Devosiaceae bacterium]|jgi:putative phosphoribosyl transferase|nr:phosphoribosyltransferase [Devosiaceae bacterium]
MFGQPKFADRRDAGSQLATALLPLQLDDPLVLALPRGGVPVAVEVARALRAPLDLLLVRKLGAPGHSEYGIGALVDGDDPQLVLNEEAMRIVAPSPEYVEAEKQRQLVELERRRTRYFGDREPLPVGGRTVVLVDDGIATGGTVRVALRALRASGAATIILAVPVAPADTLETLRAEADRTVCLETPAPFLSVGNHYADFAQTTDEEVVALLRDAS